MMWAVGIVAVLALLCIALACLLVVPPDQQDKDEW